MARIALLFLLSSMCCGLAACSDTTGPEGSDFSISVAVTTPDGEPVAGLQAALSPDVDKRFVHWPYAKAGDLPDSTSLTIRIYDLEGRLVRRLVRQSPGHFVFWDGTDDDGEPVHDGVYRHVFDVSTDDGAEVVVKTVLFLTGDPVRRADGVTGADGTFTVTDRTYVPAFYGLPPIEVIELGEYEVERIVLEPRIRMVLLDDQGRHQVVTFTAVDGRQVIDVTWDPGSG